MAYLLINNSTLVEAFDLDPASVEAIVHDRVPVTWDAELRASMRDLDADSLFWLDAYCAAHAAKHGAPLNVGADSPRVTPTP